MVDTPPAAAAPSSEPTVVEVGGTQSVQFSGDPGQQAKTEGDKTNQLPPETARPEGLPEGFDSWEAFGKAQLADKAKTSAGEAETPALTEEQQGQIAEAVKGLPEERRAAATPFFTEFAATGNLSPESTKAAAALFGVSEEMVRIYVGNAQEAGQAQAAPVIEAIGGQEVWDGFSKWAEANYTADQKAKFNAGLETDANATVADAVKAWKEAGNGPAPRDLTRGERTTNPPPQVEGYASQAEMQRDMRNPLYAKDPAFRAKVEARVGASDFGNATLR